MSVKSNNPFSLAQVEADLYMADVAIQKAESLSSKAGNKTMAFGIVRN